MPTLAGGLESPAQQSETTGPERKLRPVPLPWLRAKKPVPQSEPAVLLVGADEKFLPAIENALSRHRVFVETTDVSTIVETVVAAAPDLIMLMGDAAKDCGNEILGQLAASPQSAVVPVVILDDDTLLDARLRAFRHGAAAVIPRSASVDAIADQVAKLAREIPERHGSALGEVGDTTLEQLVQTLATQLRAGILSVKGGSGHDAEAVRLVLGQGRPLAELIDDFVARARKHVLAAEPLHYEFAEHVSGTVQVLDTTKASKDAARGDLAQVRIVLADSDAARADNFAQELRSLGATVIVTDLHPSDVRFARMRQVDPSILLIGEAHVQKEGYDLVHRMRQDTRLRWVSLLVVRWNELWSENDFAPKSAVQRLAGTLAKLAEPENGLRERAQGSQGFDTRLEVTGPARCLRALTVAGASIRVNVNNNRLAVAIDIANKLVVGATATGRDGFGAYEGATALSAFLQLSSGRVSVKPVANPKTANVMTTIDVALNMADAEPPPIAPSLPAEPDKARPASVRPPAIAPIGNLELPPGEPPAPLSAAAGAVALSDEGLPAQPARLPRGIRPRTAVLLVALAVMQGLLIVFVWRSLAASKPLDSETDAASSAAAASSMVSAPTLSAKQPAPALSAANSPDAAEPARPKGAPWTPGVIALPTSDGSGQTAPSCEELWGQEVPRQGQYRGAAFEKSREANRWITRGDLDEAQHASCLAVRWDAENAGFLVGLGHLFLLRRDGKRAVSILKRALALDPESTRAYGLLGDALARTGDYAQAKTNWLRSGGHAVGDLDALKSMASRDLRRGDNHESRHEWLHAERMFRRAVIMAPDSVPAAVGLSRALREQDEPKPAIIWAKYAISLDSRHPAARIELGDAMALVGDLERAKLEWQEALLLEPTNRNAHQRLRTE